MDGVTPGGINEFKSLLGALAAGRSLNAEQAKLGFEVITSGDATTGQICAFLTALRVRGETVEEITGAAGVMRAKALKISAPDDAIDVVGTGGDGIGTWNISSASALVVAGAGVPVAKCGNRAFTSKSGSADVLSMLGVNLDCPMPAVERAIREAHVGFMMGPRHHSTLRYVAGARVELGFRTIINLLGPLLNPAMVRRQLAGVYDRRWIEPIATALGQLGSTHSWVVHGSDGLDEITTTGPTYVAELRDGRVRCFEITPEDAGLPRATLADLKGGTPEQNAAAIHALLDGTKGPFRDVVLLNAGATLLIAGRAANLREGVALAARSIDTGAAKEALVKLVEITQ